MSEIQDKINQILSNPEALKQVQSLGEQLGLKPSVPEPKQISEPQNNAFGDDMLKAFTKIAPMMRSLKSDDDTTRLLEALRPFLSEEKRKRLDQAEKMIKLIKFIPLIKDNGILF